MADITPIASLNGELAMPEKVWMQGPPGAAATVTVGTVTTGEPGTDAIVTNSGTESAAVLNFTIPRGETGPAGAGVPDGGTAGQLLGKTESGTAWIDPPQSGVQPDWNQNDSTALDYVKNRPFYYEELESVTVESGADNTIVGFPIFAVGDTVTVSVDGVEYSLVAYDDDGFVAIGDTISSIDNGGGQLGWQIYVSTYDGKVHFYAKEAHTVSYLVPVYHTIDPKYLPENLATKTEVQSAQTAADNAQTAADNAQTTANAAQSAANTALERVVEPYTRNTQTAPLYKNGGFSAWRGVVQEILYNKTDGYFFANGFDTTALKEEDMPNDTFCVEVYVENKSAKAFLNCFSNGSNHWGVSGFAVITDGYSQTGEILYVSSNTISTYSAKGLFLTFGAPSSMLLKSSTNNSTKKFRITVDDTGTLKATEVT